MLLAAKIAGFLNLAVPAFGSSVLQVVVTLQAIAVQSSFVDISHPGPTLSCDDLQMT